MARLPLLLLALGACEQSPSKLDALATKHAAPRAHEVTQKGKAPPVELHYQLATKTYTSDLRTAQTERRLTDSGFAGPAPTTPVIDGFTINQTRDQLVLSAHEATVDGPAAQDAIDYIVRWRQAFVGKPVTVAFDALGELQRIDAADPLLVEQVRQRLMALVVPLPDLPVGDGGQWRVRTSLVQNGLTITQLAVYTLLSHADGKWKIRVHLERRAENQPLPDVQLVGLFRTLDGEVVVDPTRLLPESGTLASEARFHTRGQADHIVENSGSLTIR